MGYSEEAQLTTDCASFLGPFKIRHPEVYGLADAGFVFGGVIGRELLYIIFSICK